MSEKVTLTFGECEHEGDLDNYAEDIKNSGGFNIENGKVDTSEEEGSISFEVENQKDFLTKFRETDSFDFCNA